MSHILMRKIVIIFQWIFCLSQGVEFQLHSQSEMGTFFPNISCLFSPIKNFFFFLLTTTYEKNDPYQNET